MITPRLRSSWYTSTAGTPWTSFSTKLASEGTGRSHEISSVRRWNIRSFSARRALTDAMISSRCLSAASPAASDAVLTLYGCLMAIMGLTMSGCPMPYPSRSPASPAHLENVRHTITFWCAARSGSAVVSQKSAYASSTTKRHGSLRMISASAFGSTVPVGLFGDGRKQIVAPEARMAATTASTSTVKSARRGTSTISIPAAFPRKEYIPKVGVQMTMALGDTTRITTSRMSSEPAPATTLAVVTPSAACSAATASRSAPCVGSG
mmetsp:Transcript_9118/g.23435  ORF Transcript_9118/g.23435 Transcript_9118/m.23435 type:complete len:265 (+) Transcript_9118:263-1057(+)